MMNGSNIHYEVSEKTQALSYGGIGAIHQMVQKIGLVDELNDRLNLLKYHLPYHESDHILNIAYNVLTGGIRLEDIELRRSDEVFLNGLGAERIPDPTTAGDFTRRFAVSDIEDLMEAINTTRQRVWKYRGRDLLDEALIDIDGTVAPTYGECKAGIEASYEESLHGTTGFERVEIDASGRGVRNLSRTPAQPGSNVGLTLDIRLQEVAEQAFGDWRGALVAIEPATGGVLAFVSKPGYDPNLFVEGIGSKAYKALQSDRKRPLYDRAVRGHYPPGSTIKPFIGLGGLETGTIRYDTSVYCPGYYQLPGLEHKYRDWKKWGHGPMDLDSAITQSCDVYYYKLAHDMGIDTLSTFLSEFGFGRRTGIDLTGESRGILPSREWKRRTKRQPWYPGETVIAGIGQGYFLTTPLQLATATAALANNGHLVTPHIVDYIESRSDHSKNPIPPHMEQIPIQSQDNWDDVHSAMLHVVNSLRGTAKRIQTDFYSIAGKTGTAQVFTV